jgi:hypothetical protein
MLSVQLVLAESEIETTQNRRKRILARLISLNLEDQMPVYEVTVKSIETLTIASIRETVPTIEQVPQRCGEMFNSISHWMEGNNLPLGPTMTIYHNESYTRENVDSECAIIIPDTEALKFAKPGDRIVVRQLESIPCAAATIVSKRAVL